MMNFVGSSPRLRGTPRPCAFGGATPRFIPAPAGNTRLGAWRVLSNAGSSPRLRGTQGGRNVSCLFLRFIPAPAGNTGPGIHGAESRSVHPRACGEHVVPAPILDRFIGSSPRLRGTPKSITLCYIRIRFIPAPAGNTPGGRAGDLSGAVHPRACGEHPTPWPHGQRPAGSSPRLRGTPILHPTPCLCDRFIPAPAGNTPRARGGFHRRPVHPRACGEHVADRLFHILACGSSPRLRGTRGQNERMIGDARFIPAPAGNTRRHARRD